MVDLDPNQILDRFSEVIGAKNDAELNKAVNKTSNTAHYWRKRGTIPLEIIAKFCDVEQLTYVLSGEKVVMAIQSDSTEAPNTEQPRAPQTEAQAPQATPDIEAVRRQVARLEGRLEQCQAINTQLLQAITELSRLGGAPARETTVH